MLRGTIYLTRADGDQFRVVLTLEGVDDVAHFKAKARARWPDCSLEYGPIAAPWGR